MKVTWSENTSEFLNMWEGKHIFVSMKDDSADAPRHFYGTIEECGMRMDELNSMGWGAFFTVNELDKSLDEGRYRTAKMLKRFRAVFIDFDNEMEYAEVIAKFKLIPPSLIVESSPRRWHVYWLITEREHDIPVNEWKKVQIGLIAKYGGDTNCKDVSRYLRLPGSINCKKKANGFIVRWTRGPLNGLPYSWESLYGKFGQLADEMGVGVSGGEIVKLGGSGGSDGFESKTNEQMMNEIKSGDNYHENLLKLTYGLKQDGMTDIMNVEFMRSLMLQVRDELKDDRWKARYEDIPRMVRECEQGIEKGSGLHEATELVKKYDEIENGKLIIPEAPGLLGDLIEDAYSMQHYQYREVATVSAIGLCAGIAGRRFNFNGLGLNVYLTLIMDTGMGKDSIGHFIRGTLLGLNEVGGASSFLGSGRFTGPKSVIDRLKDARCQVSVFTEAGLLMKSKAGDQVGLGRMLLSLYSASGHDKYNGSESYSKKEDSIMMLRAPTLSIINEATPSTLHEAFSQNNALETGDVPRQSIFRVNEDKPRRNRNVKEMIGADRALRLRSLVKRCQETQAHEDPKAYMMKWENKGLEDAHWDVSDDLIKRENMARKRGDRIMKIMLSRAEVKLLKYSALASVLNHEEAVVKESEWEWAKNMIEYELAGVESFFRGSGQSDESEHIIKSIIAPWIVRHLNGEIATGKASKSDLKQGIFSAVAARQGLKNNMSVQNLAVSLLGKYKKGSSAVDVFLDMMVDREYLQVVHTSPKRLKVTNAFKYSLM